MSSVKNEARVKCYCESNNCNGKNVTVRTMKRHVRSDFVKRKAAKESMNSQNISAKCTYYPPLYDSHWTAQTKLYEGSDHSVLDYVYMEIRNFVSHPSHTKEAVSTNFETNRKILPQPNHACDSFADARTTITDFLLLIVKYDVCPNDCVIFTGEHEDKQVCLKTST